MITQIGLIDSEIIANNCFSKFDWTLFYISKLVGAIVQGPGTMSLDVQVQAILLGHCLTPSLDIITNSKILKVTLPFNICKITQEKTDHTQFDCRI